MHILHFLNLVLQLSFCDPLKYLIFLNVLLLIPDESIKLTSLVPSSKYSDFLSTHILITYENYSYFFILSLLDITIIKLF
ncbi:hypothetical protein CULT_590059 [[Clostridium] ultunense Esp]|nr:hypothetical protein CULT_590059 [[Clostridium] ultunense Esp]